MANEQIYQFTAAQPLSATDLVAGSQLISATNTAVKIGLSAILSFAGVSLAPAASQNIATGVSIPVGGIYNYFNSPYAGLTTTTAYVGPTVNLQNQSTLIGGNWSGYQTATQLSGVDGQILFATLIGQPLGGEGTLIDTAGVNDSLIIGNAIDAGGYGVLTNNPATIDGLLIAHNIIYSVIADAIELNAPAVLQQNSAITGNTLAALEFAYGNAAFKNAAFVGNVIKYVTGNNAGQAIHFEDAQHSNNSVGNVGQQISGCGIQTQSDYHSPRLHGGVVSVGNNLRSLSAQTTGSVAAGVLTVTAIVGDGYIGPYLFLQGAGITAYTNQITSQLTGTPGGIGTYAISGSSPTLTSQTIYLISSVAGYNSVLDANGSLPDDVVVGNLFERFGVGISVGSMDKCATGNVLVSDIGNPAAAIHQQDYGNLWGENSSRNYPTLLNTGPAPVTFCGKINSATTPTLILQAGSGGTLKGFSFPIAASIANGVNTIALCPTPLTAWGRIIISMITAGSTAAFVYSATFTINGSTIASIGTDLNTELFNITMGTPALTISGGKFNVVFTSSAATVAGSIQIDFEGFYRI
jgi:hypothetical protein